MRSTRFSGYTAWTCSCALSVPTGSMERVVESYQAMRGTSFLAAVILAAEIGDVRRYDMPPQLMAFLGLIP